MNTENFPFLSYHFVGIYDIFNYNGTDGKLQQTYPIMIEEVISSQVESKSKSSIDYDSQPDGRPGGRQLPNNTNTDVDDRSPNYSSRRRSTARGSKVFSDPPLQATPIDNGYDGFYDPSEVDPILGIHKLEEYASDFIALIMPKVKAPKGSKSQNIAEHVIWQFTIEARKPDAGEKEVECHRGYFKLDRNHRTKIDLTGIVTKEEIAWLRIQAYDVRNPQRRAWFQPIQGPKFNCKSKSWFHVKVYEIMMEQ